MSGDEGNKRKRFVPVVPKMNKKKKIVGESSNTAKQTNQVVVAANDQVLDLAQHTEVVVATEAAANQVGASSE